MSDHDTQYTGGEWLPLMDYAIKKGVSLSTLRRHIKAKKVDYKIENGRYLIFDDSPDETDQSAQNFGFAGAQSALVPKNKTQTGTEEAAVLKSALKRSQSDLQMAREEIAELKTLIALYEEKLPHPKLNN